MFNKKKFSMFISLILLESILPAASSPLGEIARRMCNKYSSAVYKEESSPVLSLRMETETVSYCGIVDIPLIIGGIRARQFEFPHMAVLGYFDYVSNELKWLCGGSLISESFVLTASHCLNSTDYGTVVKVMVGSIDLSSTSGIKEDEDDVQIKSVLKSIPHPHYRPPSKYNDIALIQLKTPVQFTKSVRPACIKTEETPPDSDVTAIGFGKLAYDAEEGSKYLMKVQLKIIPLDECKKSFGSKKYSMRRGLQTSMLCAGNFNGGRDTCQGDSGGPLQIILKQPYCMYQIVAVTSFGKFCGFPNSPSIYTKTEPYVDWIENTVWPLEK